MATADQRVTPGITAAAMKLGLMTSPLDLESLSMCLPVVVITLPEEKQRMLATALSSSNPLENS